MSAWVWNGGGATVALLAPLAAITFYLRSLREFQLVRHAELLRRFELLEAAAGELRNRVAAFERDYAAKEEWLRECMYARGQLEHLVASVARLEARDAPRAAAATAARRSPAPEKGE